VRIAGSALAAPVEARNPSGPWMIALALVLLAIEGVLRRRERAPDAGGST
jgi:hypothetical protein